MLVVFASVIGWQVWKLHLYNNAVREAKAAGFQWWCNDTISLIRQDWHNALKMETWGEHPANLTWEKSATFAATAKYFTDSVPRI